MGGIPKRPRSAEAFHTGDGLEKWTAQSAARRGCDPMINENKFELAVIARLDADMKMLESHLETGREK